MTASSRDARGRVKAGKSSQTGESGQNKMVEGKKSQISEASRSFMHSHGKESGKYVMI